MPIIHKAILNKISTSRENVLDVLILYKSNILHFNRVHLYVTKSHQKSSTREHDIAKKKQRLNTYARLMAKMTPLRKGTQHNVDERSMFKDDKNRVG